jgi:GMP synthase (glutamine-hydrolysing)
MLPAWLCSRPPLDLVESKAYTPTIMSRTAVAVRHVLFEDLGILAPLLNERGYSIRHLDAGVDRVDTALISSADLVVVLGGPLGVYDTDRYPFLSDELAAIQKRLTSDKPTLGLCLGAQLMAQSLGAQVKPTGRAEIGYSLLTLTDHGCASVLRSLESVPVLHWHGDQFDIPAGALRLAETPGFPNQAFSIGTRILGLQFHLETEHTQIERWLIGHSHELMVRQIDPATIRRDAGRFGPDLTRVARAIFAEWMDQI